VTLKLRRRDKKMIFTRNYVYVGTRQKNSDRFMIGEKVGDGIKKLNIRNHIHYE